MLVEIHWEKAFRLRSASATSAPASSLREIFTTVARAARFTTASVLDQGWIEVVMGRINEPASSGIAGMIPGSLFAFWICEANVTIRLVVCNRTNPSNGSSDG